MVLPENQYFFVTVDHPFTNHNSPRDQIVFALIYDHSSIKYNLPRIRVVGKIGALEFFFSGSQMGSKKIHSGKLLDYRPGTPGVS